MRTASYLTTVYDTTDARIFFRRICGIRRQLVSRFEASSSQHAQKSRRWDLHGWVRTSYGLITVSFADSPRSLIKFTTSRRAERWERSWEPRQFISISTLTLPEGNGKHPVQTIGMLISWTKSITVSGVTSISLAPVRCKRPLLVIQAKLVVT